MSTCNEDQQRREQVWRQVSFQAVYINMLCTRIRSCGVYRFEHQAIEQFNHQLYDQVWDQTETVKDRISDLCSEEFII